MQSTGQTKGTFQRCICAKFAPVGCPTRQTNPNQQTETVRSIIQVTVIKDNEQDTRGNTGHRRDSSGSEGGHLSAGTIRHR